MGPFPITLLQFAITLLQFPITPQPVQLHPCIALTPSNVLGINCEKLHLHFNFLN